MNLQRIQRSPEITLGQGDLAEPEVDPNYVPVMRGKLDRFGVAMGTGRRKTSVARVRLKEGSGEFKVNGRPFDAYFAVERDREMIQAPLKLVERLGKVDVSVPSLRWRDDWTDGSCDSGDCPSPSGGGSFLPS